MYLMVDNYDSFVYNLACYLEECGEQVELVRNDKISAEEIERILETGNLEGVVISPGPKSPKDCGKVSRKSSGFGDMSGTSDYRICIWSRGGEGRKTHAWKGHCHTDQSEWFVSGTSSGVSGDALSFLGGQQGEFSSVSGD